MTSRSNQDHAVGTEPSAALVFQPPATRRVQAALLTVALLAASVAGCAPTAPSSPYDVGSMAFPAPLPEGNLGTLAVSGRQTVDTGNMAYPAALPQGNVGTRSVSGRRTTDTGSMAYPAPSPAGTISTTTTR